jgi:hypothetical protein
MTEVTVSVRVRTQTARRLPPWLVKALRGAALKLLAIVVLAILNPFETVSWSQMRSHDLWERAQAGSYANPPGRTPSGSSIWTRRA